MLVKAYNAPAADTTSALLAPMAAGTVCLHSRPAVAQYRHNNAVLFIHNAYKPHIHTLQGAAWGGGRRNSTSALTSSASSTNCSNSTSTVSKGSCLSPTKNSSLCSPTKSPAKGAHSVSAFPVGASPAASVSG
jgi:hypothetical protein